MQAVYDKYLIVVTGNIAKRLGWSPEAVKASPIIDILIQLLPLILPLLLQCFAPKPAAHEAHNPGVLSRWQLRKIVRDHMAGDDNDTLAMREHVFRALLAAGPSVTEEDMTAVAGGAIAA